MAVGHLLGVVDDRADLGRREHDRRHLEPAVGQVGLFQGVLDPAGERSQVLNLTLPVLMCVATSEKPAASVAATMSALGNLRFGPRLIAVGTR